MRKFSLRAARAQAGLTKIETAERLGVNIATIWRWERGTMSPPARTAVRICELYGLDFNEIDWTGKEKKHEET